jgi:HEPN domain-containing protein
MRRRDDPQVVAWFAKVADDLETSERLLKDAPHLAAVIQFHSQQAAEKTLKALLTALDVPVPKTHDLDVLVTQLLPHAPELATVRDAASWLAPFAVDSRYPSFVQPDANPEATARQALEYARSVLEAVETLLSRGVSTEDDEA